MSPILLILIVLVILFFVGSPNMGYHSYGWGPSGLIGVVLIVLLILFLMGRFSISTH